MEDTEDDFSVSSVYLRGSVRAKIKAAGLSLHVGSETKPRPSPFPSAAHTAG